MPRYVRAKFKGSVFFFTVVLAERPSDLLVDRYVERGLLAADWGGDMKDIQGLFGE
jgi:hypothetical protein